MTRGQVHIVKALERNGAPCLHSIQHCCNLIFEVALSSNLRECFLHSVSRLFQHTYVSLSHLTPLSSKHSDVVTFHYGFEHSVGVKPPSCSLFLGGYGFEDGEQSQHLGKSWWWMASFDSW